MVVNSRVALIVATFAIAIAVESSLPGISVGFVINALTSTWSTYAASILAIITVVSRVAPFLGRMVEAYRSRVGVAKELRVWKFPLLEAAWDLYVRLDSFCAPSDDHRRYWTSTQGFPEVMAYHCVHTTYLVAQLFFFFEHVRQSAFFMRNPELGRSLRMRIAAVQHAFSTWNVPLPQEDDCFPGSASVGRVSRNGSGPEDGRASRKPQVVPDTEEAVDDDGAARDRTLEVWKGMQRAIGDLMASDQPHHVMGFHEFVQRLHENDVGFAGWFTDLRQDIYRVIQ